MSGRVIPIEIPNTPQMINSSINSSNKGSNNCHLNNMPVEPYSNPTYSTPLNTHFIVMVTISFIAGIGVLSFSIASAIIDKKKSILWIGLLGIFFIIIGFIIGSCTSLATTITVDYNLGVIIFKTKKICCCFSISKVIQINQIQQVIVKNNFKTHIKLKKHGKIYFTFGISFKLTDGTKIKGCSSLIDRKNEGRKAFGFLKKNLPKQITFSGNLTRRE